MIRVSTIRYYRRWSIQPCINGLSTISFTIRIFRLLSFAEKTTAVTKSAFCIVGDYRIQFDLFLHLLIYSYLYSTLYRLPKQVLFESLYPFSSIGSFIDIRKRTFFKFDISVNRSDLDVPPTNPSVQPFVIHYFSYSIRIRKNPETQISNCIKIDNVVTKSAKCIFCKDCRFTNDMFDSCICH